MTLSDEIVSIITLSCENLQIFLLLLESEASILRNWLSILHFHNKKGKSGASMFPRNAILA
jgi:hypothetical protein